MTKQERMTLATELTTLADRTKIIRRMTKQERIMLAAELTNTQKGTKRNKETKITKPEGEQQKLTPTEIKPEKQKFKKIWTQMNQSDRKGLVTKLAGKIEGSQFVRLTQALNIRTQYVTRK